MTIDKIREAYETLPFRLFTIHLADWRAVPVKHRDFIMTVLSGRTIVVTQPDDRLNIIDLLLVTDLEPTNGKKKRAKKSKNK